MVVEIAAGIYSGSMALLADGWHMGTHVAALAISLFAYWYARKHADDQRFTFGTGKVSALGGFASAAVLAIVALLMGVEAVQRIIDPRTIAFDEAIVVAVVGLAVNLFSAFLLSGRHAQDSRGSHERDHNLRAAYLHVVADTVTSLLAIFALLAGKYAGAVWLDPLMAIVGGLLIARWSYGLIRDTGHVLTDSAADPNFVRSVRTALESDQQIRICDLHLWKIASERYGAIISLVSDDPQQPEYYKKRLAQFNELVHLTVEVIDSSADSTGI